MRNTILFVTVMLMLIAVSMVFAANIWHDDFNAASMNAAYKQPDSGNGKNPPKWVQEGGVMKQTEPKPGDPTYLALEISKDISFCGQLVRIRFDQWEDAARCDRCRAGVGFWLDANDKYNGYTTVVHLWLGAFGNYQFLNDARAWDNDTWTGLVLGKVGVWFWMRTEIDAATKKINSKAWLGELKDEPENWMLQVADYTKYGAVRNSTKWVGLNGGSGNAAEGFSTVSFDDWYVYDAGGVVTAAVDQSEKLSVTWGKIKNTPF